MAIYITATDFTNINFNKSPLAVRQVYIDNANLEIEDLAERLGVMDITLIQTPIHYIIKRYAINYAHRIYAEDLIGCNDMEISGVDIYKDLFERSQYLINQLLPDITYEMITGNVLTRDDRSVSFGKLVRG